MADFGHPSIPEKWPFQGKSHPRFSCHDTSQQWL
jgi:hypothetical protein